MESLKIKNIIYSLKMFIVFLYGKNIIPNTILPKRYKKNFITGKLFYFNRKIKYSKKGYFYVYPLHNQVELDSYLKIITGNGTRVDLIWMWVLTEEI